MACKVEFESEDRCRMFFENATNEDSHDALSQLWWLVIRYREKHAKTAARLMSLFELGEEIYELRFSEAWCPF